MDHIIRFCISTFSQKAASRNMHRDDNRKLYSLEEWPDQGKEVYYIHKENNRKMRIYKIVRVWTRTVESCTALEELESDMRSFIPFFSRYTFLSIPIMILKIHRNVIHITERVIKWYEHRDIVEQYNGDLKTGFFPI